MTSHRHLMAKFRRIAFDWKPPNRWGEHEAPLETGHTLRAWPTPGTPDADNFLHPHRWENEGWNWAIVDSRKDPEFEEPWLDSGGRDTRREGDPTPPIPSLEHAKSQAEEAFKRKFPHGGSNISHHDSGLDYSDLNAFKDFL